MTTFKAVVDGLEGLTVTGVTTAFTAGPPAQVTTAQLPAKWLELPHGEERAIYAGKEGGLRTIYVEMIVALEAVVRDTSIPVTWDTLVSMMDNISTALQGYASPFTSPMAWKSRLGIVNVGSQYSFWAIITEISGLG